MNVQDFHYYYGHRGSKGRGRNTDYYSDRWDRDFFEEFGDEIDDDEDEEFEFYRKKKKNRKQRNRERREREVERENYGHHFSKKNQKNRNWDSGWTDNFEYYDDDEDEDEELTEEEQAYFERAFGNMTEQEFAEFCYSGGQQYFREDQFPYSNYTGPRKNKKGRGGKANKKNYDDRHPRNVMWMYEDFPSAFWEEDDDEEPAYVQQEN